jgi:hypothetical protein
VPELGHFHVAILLSPAARGGMELLSRKGVVLEWFVEDPGAQPGDPAATRAAFARLRESLERQVRELVEAVLGGERLKPGGT